MLSEHGFFCSNIECRASLSTPSLAVQLDLQLRNFISKFYEAWLVCDEPTCGNRTRMMSVYGKKCLVSGCRGAMHFEVSRYCCRRAHPRLTRSLSQYSDAKLYDQLLYIDTLFDIERALTKVAGGSQQGPSRFRPCLPSSPRSPLSVRRFRPIPRRSEPPRPRAVAQGRDEAPREERPSLGIDGVALLVHEGSVALSSVSCPLLVVYPRFLLLLASLVVDSSACKRCI